MSILFTFPGQGAQRAGMLHALPSNAIVREILEATSDTLGRDVLALDSEQALRSTVSVQLCLLTAGVAVGRCLMQQAGAPDAVAGFSIGAFAAAVIAGVLAYPDAVRLVVLRAQLMETAYPAGYGMTAILGLEEALLRQIISQVHGPESPVYLANLNAPNQQVIAGSHGALQKVAQLALAHGAHGARPVAISVPSHCPLLDGPAHALAQAMAEAPPGALRCRYFSASAGRELRNAERIRDDLAHNMARPVRWHETMALADELGMHLLVEMPPGSVLTRLAATAQPQCLALAAADSRLDTIAVLMQRERMREA